MNAVSGFFAGHTVAIDWTAQTWTANVVIWLLSIWKGVGWSFIIFLAALDGIPRQLLESARIDGAREWRVWRHVVLPSIRGAVTFVTVLLVIGAAQVFTQIFEITKGGPYNSTQSMMTYMYQQAFSNFAFGYAAALASLLAVVLFGLSAAEIRIMRHQDL
jgi:multiple sugar transport system permease protein